MPYNVISLTSTVIGLFFGQMFNALISRKKDEEKKKEENKEEEKKREEKKDEEKKKENKEEEKKKEEKEKKKEKKKPIAETIKTTENNFDESKKE